MKDTQKQQVYDGEVRATTIARSSGDPNLLILNEEISTDLAEVSVWLNRIVSSNWWEQRFKPVDFVNLRYAHGRSRHATARRIDNRISTLRSSWGRSYLVMCHELAHLAVWKPCMIVRRDHRSHGRDFVRAMLAIVERWVSKEAKDLLLRSYKRYDVKYHRLRAQRTLTPEQRKAAVKRAAVARAAKERKWVEEMTRRRERAARRIYRQRLLEAAVERVLEKS